MYIHIYLYTYTRLSFPLIPLLKPLLKPFVINFSCALKIKKKFLSAMFEISLFTFAYLGLLKYNHIFSYV